LVQDDGGVIPTSPLVGETGLPQGSRMPWVVPLTVTGWLNMIEFVPKVIEGVPVSELWTIPPAGRFSVPDE
jgi:hypothetical protein